MLIEWGLTPREFGALERHEKLFIERGWSEYVDRINDSVG